MTDTRKYRAEYDVWDDNVQDAYNDGYNDGLDDANTEAAARQPDAAQAVQVPDDEALKSAYWAAYDTSSQGGAGSVVAAGQGLMAVIARVKAGQAKGGQE